MKKRTSIALQVVMPLRIFPRQPAAVQSIIELVWGRCATVPIPRWLTVEDWRRAASFAAIGLGYQGAGVTTSEKLCLVRA